MAEATCPTGTPQGRRRRHFGDPYEHRRALLAPIFLGVRAGDGRFARMAAIETVSAYRGRSQADLLTIAQIDGCGLAALSSLSLAMANDISLRMTLRPRGNATALNRAAEQSRRALGRTCAAAHSTSDPSLTAAAKPEQDKPATANATAAALAQHLNASARDIKDAAVNSIQATRPTKNQGNRGPWASATADEAAKLTAPLTGIPPDSARKRHFRQPRQGDAQQ